MARVNPKQGGLNAANNPRVKFVMVGQYVSKVRMVRWCQNRIRSFVSAPRLMSEDFAIGESAAGAFRSLVTLSGPTGCAVGRR